MTTILIIEKKGHNFLLTYDLRRLRFFASIRFCFLHCFACKRIEYPCKMNKDGSDPYRPAPSKPVSHPPRSYAAKPSQQTFYFFNLYPRDKLPRRVFSFFVITSHTTPSLRTIPFVISTPRCITPCIWFWFYIQIIIF